MKYRDENEMMGRTLGTMKNLDKLDSEKMFTTPKGHGFAAESANYMYDRIAEGDIFGTKVIDAGKAIDPQTGHIVKNGADRIVNGIQIQSKYCCSGSACVKECFENGRYKYYNPDGTPMQLEVPSDKYADAVTAMKNRIRNGEVPGVTDPNEAEKIIKRGHFTYNQAKNIAKAGTIESVTYDSVTGAINAAQVFGITAVITFASAVWHGESYEAALKKCVHAGLNVAGTSFAVSVITSQLARCQIKTTEIVGDKVVEMLGKKATKYLAKVINGGKDVGYKSAKATVSRYFGNDIVTGVVTAVVLSAKDISDIFRGCISGGQFVKDVSEITASIAGGIAGKAGGAAAGAAIGTAIAPGIGTAIGGTIGGLVGGTAGGMAAGGAVRGAMDQIIDDDSDKLLRTVEVAFSKLCREYLVSRDEAEKICGSLNELFTPNILKLMYKSQDRMEFAYSSLVPVFDDTVKAREHIEMPSSDEMVKCLKTILEEAADHEVNSTAAIVCIKCGNKVAPHNKFCTKCGNSIVTNNSIICPDCGAEYKTKYNFCKKCGRKFE